MRGLTICYFHMFFLGGYMQVCNRLGFGSDFLRSVKTSCNVVFNNLLTAFIYKRHLLEAVGQAR